MLLLLLLKRSSFWKSMNYFYKGLFSVSHNMEDLISGSFLGKKKIVLLGITNVVAYKGWQPAP